MAGAPRCCYRLAMAHEYLHIARRANVAQALLLAASALLPTLAASGPRKRRVATARRSACATTAPVKLFLRCHIDVGIDGYADRRPCCSRRLPIARPTRGFISALSTRRAFAILNSPPRHDIIVVAWTFTRNWCVSAI